MSVARDRASRPPTPAGARIVATIASGPLYRRLPIAVFAVVVCAGLTLVAIGVRSPYTHANLAPGLDARYERTPQALVGVEAEFGGLGPRARPAGTDAIALGASLYVTAGCAGCHGLGGEGGAVGPKVVGIDPDKIAQRVRQGPLGMPRFSAGGLGDDEISAIAAYLRSLETD